MTFLHSILIFYGTGDRDEHFYNDGGDCVTLSLANVHFDTMLKSAAVRTELRSEASQRGIQQRRPRETTS